MGLVSRLFWGAVGLLVLLIVLVALLTVARRYLPRPLSNVAAGAQHLAGLSGAA